MKSFTKALAGNYELGENRKLVHFVYTLQMFNSFNRHKLMLLSEENFKKENLSDFFSAATLISADDCVPSLVEIAANPEFEGRGYASGILRLGLNMVREPSTTKLNTLISCNPKGQKRRLDFFKAMGFEAVPEQLNDFSVVRSADADHPRLKTFKNQTVLAKESAHWEALIRSGEVDNILEKSVLETL